MGGRRVIFTRKIESELLLWKNAANRKPIVLRGARIGITVLEKRRKQETDCFAGGQAGWKNICCQSIRQEF